VPYSGGKAIRPQPYVAGSGGLTVGPSNRSTQKERSEQVFVSDDNIDRAFRVPKKKMRHEGMFREMKLRGHCEQPSERRVREKTEAIRRTCKLARKSCNAKTCCR
jgi:small subunit ribosomal protein S21